MTQATNVDHAPGDWSVAGADFIGFGSAEIAYLFSRYQGAALDRTAQLMKLNPAAASEQFVASGASSLLARGLLTMKGEELDLLGPAAIAAFAIAGAEHWTEIGFMAERDQAADGALLLRAGEVQVLLRPRALGTWFMMVKSPKVTGAQAVLALAGGFLGEHPDGAVFLGAHTSEWDATLFLRPTGEGSWELARGDAPFWKSSGVEEVDADAATAALDLILGTPRVQVA